MEVRTSFRPAHNCTQEVTEFLKKNLQKESPKIQDHMTRLLSGFVCHEHRRTAGSLEKAVAEIERSENVPPQLVL